VTGGATGIGRAISEELVTLGCKVVIASRNEERLQAVATELCPQQKKVIPKHCNIRNEEHVRSLISSTVSEQGRLDFLINNGGGQFPSPAENISAKGWNAVVETNLTGTFLMCREAYTSHMSSHGGAIVNIIADMFRGFPLMAHTGAARAAVDNLTKTLAIEWADAGVRVNAVAPGSCVFSPTAAANYGSFNVFEQVRGTLPSQRLAHPREISSAVSFLCSPGASFISGATLRVDAAASLYSPQLKQISEHDKWPPVHDWEYKLPEGDD